MNKLAFGLFVIIILSFNGLSAQAETYYGKPREYTLYNPVKCPPNYTERGAFCRPLVSEFCEAFTGSDAVSEIDGRPVCASPPIFGACSDGINYTPPSLNQIDREFVNSLERMFNKYAGIEGRPASNQQVTGSQDNISHFLFDGGSNRFRLRDGDNIKSDTYKAVSCLARDNKNFITLPVVTNLKAGSWNESFDFELAAAGLAMETPTHAGYCKSPSDGAISYSGFAFEESGRTLQCVEGILGATGGQAFLINYQSSSGTQSINISNCITKAEFNRDENFPKFGIQIFNIVGVGVGSNSADTVLTVEGSDSVRCLRTAKELFQTRSNKGCSDFTTIEANSNRLIELGSYDNCVKCLYGEPALLPESIDASIVSQSSPIKPNPKDPITPYNEPLAKPLSGRLYTDLGGCINASSTGSVVNTIVRVALGVMGGVVILRIIQGALTMQKGDPEGFQEGRDVITSALIGLLLLIFSAAMLNFLGINILGLDVATFGS